eukprot:TRINITY_DN6536_c1_g1_i1.p1 TRINITY_DN6536_c1_g1~~TRINITY_DN6536_c1_g1_i1.p1  ORF type:complete len:351 (+),score=104.06 TRINITY_DN6536_c1_g1_i1:33-1085(+)
MTGIIDNNTPQRNPSTMMRAILTKKPGGIENLVVGSIAKPVLRPDGILVRVHATAVNRADILQREGKYPPPPGESEVLGLEMAGVVEEVGNEVNSWKVGDRVMGLLGGGGYAEYCVITGSHAMKIPEKFSFEEAAAIPEAFLTAFQALQLSDFQNPPPGKQAHSLLLHAAASGVGTAALQIARCVKLNPIIATAGSAEKLEACKNLGATHTINYKDGSFVPHVLSATDNKGVSILMDFIGASYFNDNLKSMCVDGSMTMQGSMGGVKVSEAEIGGILGKRLTIRGSTLRARDKAYKTKLISDFAAFALPRFESGELKPIVAKVFDLEKTAEAHSYVEGNHNIGKVIISLK